MQDAAARLKERSLSGCLIDLDREAWWASEAYLATERARRVVEAEPEEDQPSLDEQMAGDSGAFKFVN